MNNGSLTRKFATKRKADHFNFKDETKRPAEKKSKRKDDDLDDFLSSNDYEAIECGGRGNCFFLSIAFLLGNSKGNSHTQLRKRTCDFMEKNINRFSGSFEYDLNPTEYITNMRKLGIDAGHPEIKALSFVLKRTIKIYESRFLNGRSIGFQFKAKEFYKSKYPALLIRHIPEIHYQAIVTKKIEINLNKKTNIKERENTTFNQNQELSQENIDFKLSEIPKRKKGENYLVINKCQNLYEDISKYYETDQKYIPAHLETKGKAFCKLRGKFKEKCKQFIFDQNLNRILHCEEVAFHYIPQIPYKPAVKNKNDSYQCYFYIPLNQEKQIILETTHNRFLHNGRDRMLVMIRKAGYSWFNITKDVKDYINNCQACRFKNLKKSKTAPTTVQIIAKYPRHIYQVDMVQLSCDYQSEQEKYLIVIGDHFSKFIWSTISGTKEAKNIEEALRIFFSFCGKPEILQSDNGREFVNQIIEGFLKKQGIEFIHGRPYHPQSQGFIERVNRTIQQSLNTTYSQNSRQFNLKDTVQDIIQNYNSNYHTTIKMSPKEAFSLNPNNPTDKHLINKITENTKKSFENKISINNYQIGQKVILHNVVVAKKECLVATKQQKKLPFKKGFSIPATVVAIYKSTVKIQIDKNELIVGSKLIKDSKFKVALNLIKLISEKEWNMLV